MISLVGHDQVPPLGLAPWSWHATSPHKVFVAVLLVAPRLFDQMLRDSPDSVGCSGAAAIAHTLLDPDDGNSAAITKML